MTERMQDIQTQLSRPSADDELRLVPAASVVSSLPRKAEHLFAANADRWSGRQLPKIMARIASDLIKSGLRPESWMLDVTPAGGYQSYLVYVAPSRQLSVEWLVWPPGATTPVHNHSCWCVVSVADGAETEIRYRESRGQVKPFRENVHHSGQAQILVPPRDIHQVVNLGIDTAVSLHIYGTDIRRRGTSIERVFDPVETDMADLLQR